MLKTNSENKLIGATRYEQRSTINMIWRGKAERVKSKVFELTSKLSSKLIGKPKRRFEVQSEPDDEAD